MPFAISDRSLGVNVRNLSDTAELHTRSAVFLIGKKYKKWEQRVRLRVAYYRYHHARAASLSIGLQLGTRCQLVPSRHLAKRLSKPGFTEL